VEEAEVEEEKKEVFYIKDNTVVNYFEKKEIEKI